MHKRIIARFCEICVAVYQIKKLAKNTTEETLLNGEGFSNYNAILMFLVSIGESANEIKSNHFDFAKTIEINWKGWADLRNIISHNYEGIDVFTVLRIIEKNIPILHEQLVIALENNQELQDKVIEHYKNRKSEAKFAIFVNSDIIDD